MANLGQMVSFIQAGLIDTNSQAVSRDQIVYYINDSIDHWKNIRFWFNERFGTDVLTPQDGTIPLPADFLIPATNYDGFLIEYSYTRYPLQKITQQQYDGLYLANGYGLPRTYARVGQDYEVYFLPDRSYTIKMHYLTKQDTLENDDDTNDFTDYASRLINLWTLANISGELRQDASQETYYRAAAEDEYTRLCVRTNKENATGRLTLSSLLTTW